MAIAGVATTVMDLYQFFKQREEAKKLKKEAEELKEGAEYKVPESVDKALRLAELQASQKELPGQSIMEQRIGQQISSGIESAEKFAPSSASALGALAGIYGQGMEAYKDLDIEAARQTQENLKNLQAVQMGRAPYEEKEWQYNKYLPYMQAAQMSAALENASLANLQAGWQTAETGVENIFGMIYGQQYGGGSQQQTQPATQVGSSQYQGYELTQEDYDKLEQIARLMQG
uniref:Uncharacterized protein n=1 Tax=viral metagenome TaxID=1070528 RepID=A0A6M3J243_9ZZZZ